MAAVILYKIQDKLYKINIFLKLNQHVKYSQQKQYK
jgi:hypothetical protein